MSIWGDLQFRIDPWDPEYGASAVFEGFDDVAADAVDLDVELDADDWTPIEGDAGRGYEQLVFVDGVRRIDARIVALHDGEIVHGLLGSYGAGAVGLGNSQVTVLAEDVGRVAVAGAGRTLANNIRLGEDLEFRAMSCVGTDARAPLETLQNQMRVAESNVAASYIREGSLVVADGPLNYADPVEGLVGFVKRIFDPYLPASKAGMLAALPSGHRTPLFSLTSNRRYARYAWFMRLAPNAPGQSPFAGVVRLEIADVVGIDRAQQVANETTALLPTLASSRSFDPRAPQNLIPVGGLEKRLKHLLGDARLVRRRIETAIAEDASRE